MGATGAVGQVFMWMLSDHPWFELAYCTASAARVGQKYASTVHWVMPFEIPEQIKEIEVKEGRCADRLLRPACCSRRRG